MSVTQNESVFITRPILTIASKSGSFLRCISRELCSFRVHLTVGMITARLGVRDLLCAVFRCLATGIGYLSELVFGFGTYYHRRQKHYTFRTLCDMMRVKISA